MEFEGRRPVASRLLLVNRVGWFVLERPVFIAAGFRFWTEPDALVIESPTGEQSRFAGSMNR